MFFSTFTFGRNAELPHASSFKSNKFVCIQNNRVGVVFPLGRGVRTVLRVRHGHTGCAGISMGGKNGVPTLAEMGIQ